jgi:multidrug resistance efflux pump
MTLCQIHIIPAYQIGKPLAADAQDGPSACRLCTKVVREAGDVLIELDPTISSAETDHVKSDFVAAELEVARLRAALAGHANPLDDFIAPADASQGLIEMQRRFLATQTAEQDAKLAEITRQLAEKEAEGETITATIDKLQAVLPPLQERVTVSKNLYDRGLASKFTYLRPYCERSTANVGASSPSPAWRKSTTAE